MKCPYCNTEMEEGGLITEGVSVGWLPLEQFKKNGIKNLVLTGLRTIGKHNLILGQTKISNAFYCNSCNKIVGVFDITNHID